MSFLEKIQGANQGLVSTSSEAYLIARPKPTDNLKTILNWVKVEGDRISKDLQSFKSHVEYLMQENNDFHQWVITSTQQNISIECGISQSYASRIFGPVQKEYKENIRQEIIHKVEKGIPYKVIAEDYGCSEKAIQRALNKSNRTKYDSDNLSSTDPETVQKRRGIMKGRTMEDLADIIISQEETISGLKLIISKQNKRSK
jgi:hypothetical protein